MLPIALVVGVATATPSSAAVPPRAPVFTGQGFDSCTAPSVDAMRAWLASPFRAVNVYLAGVNRYCAQEQLTADWVRQVREMGWAITPTVVGLQAPCHRRQELHRIDPARPWAQGRAAADEAVAAAEQLGLPRGAPLYYDMEYYDREPTCSAVVIKFLRAWTNRLHERGYRSGVYSSASAAITDLVRVHPWARPDVIWFARWDGNPSVYGSAYIPDLLWRPHRRIHQYLRAHDETWGGVTINIDTNTVDSEVVPKLAG